MVNRELDNVCGNPHSDHEINSFNTWIENNNLFDIWRLYNGDQKYYTWKHKNRPIMRRIDYLFCNEIFLEKIISADILEIPLTDHRAVKVDASYNIAKKGTGFWKFNNTIMKDLQY